MICPKCGNKLENDYLCECGFDFYKESFFVIADDAELQMINNNLEAIRKKKRECLETAAKFALENSQIQKLKRDLINKNYPKPIAFLDSNTCFGPVYIYRLDIGNYWGATPYHEEATRIAANKDVYMGFGRLIKENEQWVLDGMLSRRIDDAEVRFVNWVINSDCSKGNGVIYTAYDSSGKTFETPNYWFAHYISDARNSDSQKPEPKYVTFDDDGTWSNVID